MKTNLLRHLLCILACVGLNISVFQAQVVTDNDGSWADTVVIMFNTPEAQLMVRLGDIDNLGYGWPANFDPFSGKSTPRHPWPCQKAGEYGTDKIMIPSSYGVLPRPAGSDGYAGCSSRPLNDAESLQLTFDVSGIDVKSALLQIFIDDIQAPLWKASYIATLDSVRIPVLEHLLNQLLQTGPIGRIINFQIPDNLLYLLEDGKLALYVDDHTTGAADGYAFDFIKLLINPGSLLQKSTLVGTIKDQSTSLPLHGAEILVNGEFRGSTDNDGFYEIRNVLPGLITLQAQKTGYSAGTHSIVLSDGDSITTNFDLLSPAPKLIYQYPDKNETEVPLNFAIKMVFDLEMDKSTFNKASFFLTDSFNVVKGKYLESGDTLIFKPDTTLIKKHYKATLKYNLKSKTNKNLERDIVWEFFTPRSGLPVERINYSKSVLIYPLPSKGILNMRFKEQTIPQSFTLYNLLGKKLLHKTNINQNHQVSIAHFESGPYFGVFKYENGDAFITKIILSK